MADAPQVAAAAERANREAGAMGNVTAAQDKVTPLGLMSATSCLSYPRAERSNWSEHALSVRWLDGHASGGAWPCHGECGHGE